jgi:hypothetical protein
MKTRMFHDLEARGRNWHNELPSVLWALHTNINRATRDIPFNLVYEADAVLLPEIYLESIRVAHFNAEDQAKARELDCNLLDERRNTTLANVRKYQESLKRYNNKSVIQRELNIRDLVLKKDIRTKDKHKFLSVTPSFKARPNAHSMCTQGSSFHTYRTENGYRITNVLI